MFDTQQNVAHTPTILVVDDESGSREGVSFLLQDAGYRTQAAENGRKALTLMDARPPSLLITDLMMPEMSGRELAIAMLEKPSLASIPRILMTGAHPCEEFVISKLFQCILPKPFSSQSLLAKVATMLLLRSG